MAHATEREKRTYLLYGPDFSRRVFYLHPAAAEPFIAELKQGSIRTVYGTIGNPVIRECVKRGWLKRTIGSFLEVVPVE